MMMKRFIVTICVFYTLFVFKIGSVSSLSLAINSSTKSLHQPLEKQNGYSSTIPPTQNATDPFIKTSSLTKTSLRRIKITIPIKTVPQTSKPPGNVTLHSPQKTQPNNNVTTRKDILVLFSSENKLTSLSLSEKQSAVKLLTLSYRSTFLETEEPPSVVLQNLIALFATTEDLLELLPPDTVVVSVALITRNRYALAPKRFKPKFLARFLSLPTGDITRVPTPMLATLIGTVHQPSDLESLPRRAAFNLITVLSMSTPLFQSLPLTATASLVSFVSRDQKLLTQSPPSTLFGFLEGLLVTLNEPSGFVMDVLPSPDLVNLLSPMITNRMLSVLPTRCLDLLLAVVGSSSKLSQALPPTNFVAIFGLLATSPRQLATTDPGYLGGLLNTVAGCPHLLDGIPSTTTTQLFEAVVAHLPMCLNSVPIEVISLFLDPIQNDKQPTTIV